MTRAISPNARFARRVRARMRRYGRRTILVLPAAAISLFVSSPPAFADLKLCNRMSYVVEAAIGIDDKAATATRGWFRIDPATCRVVVQGTLTADRILLHARALGLYGSSPTPQSGADTLCIAAENFVIAAARQCRTGQTPAPFTQINPTRSDDGNLVAYLAEDSEYDDEQARLAGIQRLLVIAGYDAYPIDGVQGAKTATSDIYFVQIRPFKKDYKAQQSQAQGGGGQNNVGQLSEQQRQIVAATFNAVRDKAKWPA